MRGAIDNEGSIFVDTTGNVILPVPLRDDQQNKRVDTTALSVVVLCNGARRSKPLRVVTERSTTTVASNTKETLLLTRRTESSFFGNNLSGPTARRATPLLLSTCITTRA